MSERKTSAGVRIRQRRRSVGLRQAELASRAGISASYLNLIEHDRRRIGGKLLTKIADVLGVQATFLSEGVQATKINHIRELATPLAHEEAVQQVEDLATRFPMWVDFILNQERQKRALEAQVNALTERLSHDPRLSASLHDVLSTVTAIRSMSAILSDTENIEPEWQTRFIRNMNEESLRLSDTAGALVQFLETDAKNASGLLSPQEEVENFLETSGFDFPFLENENDHFEKELHALLDTAGLSPSGFWLLKSYFVQAREDIRKLPLAVAQSFVSASGLDPVGLAQMAGVDVPTAMRRLATLPMKQKSEACGLLICDAGGNFLFHRPIEGFRVLRYASACPLLPIFDALHFPMRPIRRVLAQNTSDVTIFDTISFAQATESSANKEQPVVKSYMFIRALNKSGANAKVQRLGPSCALCSVKDCDSRRELSLVEEGF